MGVAASLPLATAVISELAKPLIFPKEKPEKKNPFKIGKYTCLARLGSGAYGVVYRCTADDRPDEVFAMKVQTAQKQSQIEDVLKEINQHRSVSHPNLVQFREAVKGTRNKNGEEKKVVCMILEYVDGSSLEGILVGDYSPSPDLKAKWAYQLIAGVEYLHSLHKVHRDLKPANLLITRGTQDLKIGDFGLARDLDADGQASTICGTPMYMAPEIQPGRAIRLYGSEVDIWSVGMILLKLLAEVRLTRDLIKAVFTPSWETDLVNILGVGSLLAQPVWSLIYECLRYLPGDRISARNLLDSPVVQSYALVHGLIPDESEIEASVTKIMTTNESVLTIFMLLGSPNTDPKFRSWMVDEICNNIDLISSEALFHQITSQAVDVLVKREVESASRLQNLISVRKRRSKTPLSPLVVRTTKPNEPKEVRPGWYWRPVPTGSGGTRMKKLRELPPDVSGVLHHFSSQKFIGDPQYSLVISLLDSFYSFDLLGKKAKNMEDESGYELKEISISDIPSKPPRTFRTFQYCYGDWVGEGDEPKVRGASEGQWIDFPEEYQNVLNNVFEWPLIEAVTLGGPIKISFVVSFKKLSCYHLDRGYETPLRYLVESE